MIIWDIGTTEPFLLIYRWSSYLISIPKLSSIIQGIGGHTYNVNVCRWVQAYIRGKSHAVIGDQSSGFKSRPGNYSFTPVVLRSSLQVIGYCKFREGKATGRNASESVLASLTYWGCWLSGLKGKTGITGLTMSGSGKSSGVIRVACSGRLIVQDGISNAVVFAAPTDLYKP